LDITNDIGDSATTIPNLREAYIDIYGNWLDLRLGKQQVVWGKTDGYFINDIVNPLDLSYFILQDFDDIRMYDYDAQREVAPRQPLARDAVHPGIQADETAF